MTIEAFGTVMCPDVMFNELIAMIALLGSSLYFEATSTGFETQTVAQSFFWPET